MLALAERSPPYRPIPPRPDFRVSVGEPTSGPSERDLARLWEGQRFPPDALATMDGRSLHVIYRGRRGGGAGPDYRDAVIRTPGGTVKGDVELHVRAGDFRRHGHHRDPAYNDVALHLVYWPDDLRDTLLASGRRAPIAALAPWVDGRREQIRLWLERPALWREPCRSAYDRLGGDGVAVVLDRLGDIRFRQRAAQLRRSLTGHDPDEVLYGALLEALGYGGNRDAFRELARRLPWAELRPALTAMAPGERALAAQAMLARAAGQPPPLAWSVAGLRPANHPARRLEAAALTFVRHAETGLASGLRPLLAKQADGAVAALTVKVRGRAPVGKGRAVEVLSNAALPFFAALGPGPDRLRALELYRALPRPAAYGSVRHLDEAVAGEARVNARRQQGMLFLLRNYCSQGRCGSCPLS